MPLTQDRNMLMKIAESSATHY